MQLKTRNFERLPKIVVIIQARMGSTRLPGKVMRRIGRKTLVQIEFERLKNCREVDSVVLTTSTNVENNQLVKHAQKIGLQFYRGSEIDIISRHLKTAQKFNANIVVVITADCPLVDPKILDAMLKIFKNNVDKFDIVTNCFPRTYPKGLDIDMVSLQAIKTLDKKLTTAADRETYIAYMLEHPQNFRIYNFRNLIDLSKLRWTVDYQEDFEFVKVIFNKLGKSGKLFTTDDIVSLLKKEPSISKINQMWV